MPKVSVIVNCHNGEKYLKEALDSIYAQTFLDWEVVFYDNQSTDASASIAQSYDARLRYVCSTKLIPLGEARAAAVGHAQGEWVAFLDSDDIWYPEKLAMQIERLEGTNFQLCYAGVREVTADGKKIRDVYPMHSPGDMLDGLLRQFDINMVTPIFRRDLVSRLGLNFESGIMASEEYNLFVRIAAKGRVLALRELLGEYRVYANSLTDKQISKWAYERRYTLQQLKRENIGIELRYPKAFQEAYARGDYYEARYLMSEQRFREARSVMKKIKNQDNRYLLLYYAVKFPSLWTMMHAKLLRLMLIRYVSPLLFRPSR